MSLRKLCLLIIILVIPIFSYSQGAPSIEDLNGFDWNTWDINQKTGFVQGFLSANSAIWRRFNIETQFSIPESTLREYFYYPLNVVELVQRIDKYYSSYDYRKFPLLEVIMLIGGKDYWNRTQNTN